MAGDPRARLKDAKKALYAEVILDVAEAVFADVGYDDAKMQAVAKQGRTSLAKLYEVFPSKADLYRALHRRRLEVLMRDIAAAVHGCDEEPLLQILRAHTAHIIFHMENKNYLRMHLRDRIAWSSPEGLRCEEQVKAWKRGLRMMVTAIDLGVGEGTIVDEDAELLARSAMSLHQVALGLWVDRGMKQSVEQVSEAVQRQVLRLLCPADQFEGQERRLLHGRRALAQRAARSRSETSDVAIS